MTALPSPRRRIVSLDQFRGYTVAGMLLVNFIGGYHVVPAIHSLEFPRRIPAVAALAWDRIPRALRLGLKWNALSALWRANTAATPTGLWLHSRACRSLLVIWFRPHEVERGDGTQPRWG